MTNTCNVCRNLDPDDATYGSQWTTGPVFQHSYISLNQILVAAESGCMFCTLLKNLVCSFVPDWDRKADSISLHVTAPLSRPLVVQISEAVNPHQQLDELCTISVSTPSGMFRAVTAQQAEIAFLLPSEHVHLRDGTHQADRYKALSQVAFQVWALNGSWRKPQMIHNVWHFSGPVCIAVIPYTTPARSCETLSCHHVLLMSAPMMSTSAFVRQKAEEESTQR